MKALLKDRPEPGLTLADIPKPEVRNPDDVLFKVEYCAVCVGEVKVYEWNEWAANDKTLQLPTVLGHEASGVVVEVGPAVKDFKPGDRIVNDPILYCGTCRNCREGFTNMCENREIYGKRRGAFAEYAVLPERSICRLNDRLSLEEGAVLENLGIAMHAVECEHHDPGDWAVVLGCGPIGVLAVQCLEAAGVNVVATDISDARLDFARRNTGALVLDAKKEDPVARVLDLTHGRGADFVIEMAASQRVLEQAFDMVRIRGTVVTISTFNDPVSFNPFFKMTRREIRLQAVMGRNAMTWRRMEQIIDAGKLNLKPYVSCVLSLEDYARGFEMVQDHNIMKVLLKP